VLGLRTSGEIPFICCINIEEIWRGIRPGEEDDAESLINGLRLADLGVNEGRRAGRWRREAAASGVTLSQADCLIAAAAAGVGARLATGNPKHFPMKGLVVEHWLAGA
jgi:predicted nucleic acid-binding protein